MVFDIGSGFNTPVWIRWPAEEIVRANTKARLLRLNLHHSEVPEDIAIRSISFAESANDVLSLLTFRGSNSCQERANHLNETLLTNTHGIGGNIP